MRSIPAAVALTVLLPMTLPAQTPTLVADRVFDPARLVEVRIEMAPADWEALRTQTRTIADALGRTPAKRPYTWFAGQVTIDGVRIQRARVRKKGFIGSLDGVRPSLKINFGPDVRAIGFDRLTLNNNKQDKSQLSQYLSYMLFDRAGVPGSRCNFARVTVNGRALGIYSNVESIKRPLLRREFDDDSGDLYEGTVADLYPDWLQKFELKNKRTRLGPLQRIAAVLEREDLDLEALGRQLDIDAFLMFWASESLIGFWDGYTNNQNNFFLYRRPSNDKLYFVPWGTDSAFTATMPLPPYVIKRKSVHLQSLLANRLYQMPAIQKRYRATLEGLLQRIWKEDELIAEIDRVVALIGEHVHDKQQPFAGAVRKVKEFISSRRRVLGRELRRWPVRIKTGPRRPVYFESIGEGATTFDTRWTKDDPKQPLAHGKATFDLRYDGERITFGQLGVSASLSKWPTPDGSAPPPALVFTGKRATDGKQFILGVSPTREDFKPTAGKPVTVQGVLIEGRLGWMNPSAYKMVAGQAKFDAAAMEVGAAVRGTMQVRIVKTCGGETDRFKPK